MSCKEVLAFGYHRDARHDFPPLGRRACSSTAIGKPSRREGKATTSGALDAGVDREQSLTRRQKGEPPARKKRRDISTFFMVSLYFYKDDCMTCAAPMSPPGAGSKRNKNFPTLSSVEEGKDFHAMG